MAKTTKPPQLSVEERVYDLLMVDSSLEMILWAMVDGNYKKKEADMRKAIRLVKKYERAYGFKILRNDDISNNTVKDMLFKNGIANVRKWLGYRLKEKGAKMLFL